MRFCHPVEDIEFEIPESWWVSAGAHLFCGSTTSFAATSSFEWPTVLVPIAEVAAPKRDPDIEGLREERTISLLRAMMVGIAVPPLEVHRTPLSDRLTVRDGFHRYYISIALGFSVLPVSIRPYFDFDAL